MPTTPKKTAAVAAEALAAERVPLTFRGASLSVLPSAEWPLEALEAFEDGKVTTFLRSILGADDWAAVKAVAPKVGDLAEFVEAVQKALGISGN